MNKRLGTSRPGPGGVGKVGSGSLLLSTPEPGPSNPDGPVRCSPPDCAQHPLHSPDFSAPSRPDGRTRLRAFADPDSGRRFRSWRPILPRHRPGVDFGTYRKQPTHGRQSGPIPEGNHNVTPVFLDGLAARSSSTRRSSARRRRCVPGRRAISRSSASYSCRKATIGSTFVPAAPDVVSASAAPDRDDGLDSPDRSVRGELLRPDEGRRVPFENQT